MNIGPMIKTATKILPFLISIVPLFRGNKDSSKLSQANSALDTGVNQVLEKKIKVLEGSLKGERDQNYRLRDDRRRLKVTNRWLAALCLIEASAITYLIIRHVF